MAFCLTGIGVFYPDEVAAQGGFIVPRGDPQGFGEFPGAVEQLKFLCWFTCPVGHQLLPDSGHKAPDQDGMRDALNIGDYIEQVVHAIAQVNISNPSCIVHCFGALGSAAPISV